MWTCRYCKKKFDRGASAALCSIECADLLVKTLRDNYWNEYTECLSCGRRLSTLRPRKFCDARCKKDYYSRGVTRKPVANRNPKRIRFDKDVTQSIMRDSGYTCVYCGGTAEAIDHIYPLCMGGTNDRANLVASCERCNSIANGVGFRSITEKQQYIMSRR